MKADFAYLIFIILFTVFIVKENVNAGYTENFNSDRGFNRIHIHSGSPVFYNSELKKIHPKDLCESFPDNFSFEKYIKFPIIESDNSNKKNFPLNLEEYEVTSDFGIRIHPLLRKRHFHTGIDIGANKGTKIVSAFSGKVVYAGWRGNLGKTIVIKNNNMEFIYGHCSKILVKYGEKVKAGQNIGLVGKTGRATGTHLHFSVRQAGKYINPKKWFGI